MNPGLVVALAIAIFAVITLAKGLRIVPQGSDSAGSRWLNC